MTPSEITEAADTVRGRLRALESQVAQGKLYAAQETAIDIIEIMRVIEKAVTPVAAPWTEDEEQWREPSESTPTST